MVPSAANLVQHSTAGEVKMQETATEQNRTAMQIL